MKKNNNEIESIVCYGWMMMIRVCCIVWAYAYKFKTYEKDDAELLLLNKTENKINKMIYKMNIELRIEFHTY